MTTTELQKKKNGSAGGVALPAAGRDASAFTRLVEINEGMLYRVSRTILKNEADCADAVQETVITAWRHFGQLRSIGSFPAWIARICINQCYRLARSYRRTGHETEPHGKINQNDARLDVLTAVHNLPEELRLTVAFHYFEDWSIEETARVLGVFQGTVKSRLHRARRLLAAELLDYKEEKTR